MKKARKKKSQLVILNPQPFDVIVTLQPRGTNVIESKHLPANDGHWVVPPPGPNGTWISYRRVSNNETLASLLLPEGTTFAELFWDTEISLIFKQNPKEKLVLANNTNQTVIVQYELQREIAISTNTLKPSGERGSSVVARQQPRNGVDLWITFKTQNGGLLTSFLASDAISLVGVNGKAHYFITTTPL